MKHGDNSSGVSRGSSCASSGAFKWVYNLVYRLQPKNEALMDNEDAYIVGVGKYNGTQTSEWAHSETKRFLYYSYRDHFEPLENGATMDTSWGCMIRSGQMMIACAFMRFFNGGKAHIDDEHTQELREKVQFLFSDVPSAPFGIHAISSEGVKHGVPCGKWFGPTPLSNTLSSLSSRYLSTVGEGPVILTVSDRMIISKQVMNLLQDSKHVVLLIPLMVGVGFISEKYAKVVLQILEMESSIGIIGGRRSSALFLYGHQGNKVFYLDPHYTQRAFTSPESTGTLTSARRMISITSCDTSMAFGFYIASIEDFELFRKEMAKANSQLTFPLISVVAEERTVSYNIEVDDCAFSPCEERE
ncbi:AUT2/APG4/ATG4 cysteine peptidase [Trypanosoma theileri]|uniref:Cysteine protease n=1 Tax=Trypanosoma theileri TaxID=67003 RepID=A0A1X0NS04_9TRYP|nr:AUT2/APG4/ATG4 cysteine peptidase [Trypanosoma theileri]ORC87482.1 AUT2/APG4/ATG4 cysteine peptidase [Trypanosoma theileri]